jgi:hypothetical protein
MTLSVIMLGVALFYCDTECHHAERRDARFERTDGRLIFQRFSRKPTTEAKKNRTSLNTIPTTKISAQNRRRNRGRVRRRQRRSAAAEGRAAGQLRRRRSDASKTTETRERRMTIFRLIPPPVLKFGAGLFCQLAV